MEHGKLISTYFKNDGGKAKVYRIRNDEQSFFSIAYFNSRDVMILEEEFMSYSLMQVEEAAEDWSLGIRSVI